MHLLKMNFCQIMEKNSLNVARQPSSPIFLCMPKKSEQYIYQSFIYKNLFLICGSETR
eukprot:UN17630